MIIQYKNEVPTVSELHTRVYELEQALMSVACTLVGTYASVDMPREHISPLVIKVQLAQAQRIIKQVL